MIALRVILDLEGAWPDLAEKIRAGNGVWLGGEQEYGITVGALPHGMETGNPSVAIRIDYGGGRVLVAETSLRLFLQAAAALRGRYGEP